MTYSIRRAVYPDDADALLELWYALFPDAQSRSEEMLELRRWFERSDAATFVAFADADPSRLIGYADVGERPYVDGCRSSPVAYLEAWFVAPARRNRGIGEALIRAAESWARQRGHTELASDTTLDNTHSQHLHKKFGFEETDRIVQFRKSL
jgi:aminoglycoside 6'-N-acetyltransferase I